MFHPVGHPMERGWVGRIDGDRVIHLAAQTLQSFFTGGGTAREHAEYPFAEVRLLAPVLHPPSIRVFDDQQEFAFANPAAVVGPGGTVTPPPAATEGTLTVRPRPAVVIGADAAIGGFTILAEWRASRLERPKDRDFGLGLGPVLVTADEAEQPSATFDWAAAVGLAASGTRLYPGDVIAGPAGDSLDVAVGSSVSLSIDGLGVLEQRLERVAHDGGV